MEPARLAILVTPRANEPLEFKNTEFYDKSVSRELSNTECYDELVSCELKNTEFYDSFTDMLYLKNQDLWQ